MVAFSTDPVLIPTRTRIVPGAPLTYTGIAALDDAGSDQVAADLAAFLARLHDPLVLHKVQLVAPMVASEPQADTNSLRQRFGRWVSAGRRDAGDPSTWVDELAQTMLEAGVEAACR